MRTLTSFSAVGTVTHNRLDLLPEPRIGVGVGRRIRAKTGGSGLASRLAGLRVVGAPMTATQEPRSPSHDHEGDRQSGQI